MSRGGSFWRVFGESGDQRLSLKPSTINGCSHSLMGMIGIVAPEVGIGCIAYEKIDSVL